MNAFRAANLALRFLLELAALTAVGYWGATAPAAPIIRIALAVALPSIVAVAWGLFISPKARFPTGTFGRALLGLVAFLLAAAALWSRGRTTLAAVYASLALVSSVVILFLPQPTPARGEAPPS